MQWAVRAETSLDYYLESMEVRNLQDLKDLMLSDKIRVINIKSHILVKERTKWLKPVELGKNIDLYV